MKKTLFTASILAAFTCAATAQTVLYDGEGINDISVSGAAAVVTATEVADPTDASNTVYQFSIADDFGRKELWDTNIAIGTNTQLQFDLYIPASSQSDNFSGWDLMIIRGNDSHTYDGNDGVPTSFSTDTWTTVTIDVSNLMSDPTDTLQRFGIHNPRGKEAPGNPTVVLMDNIQYVPEPSTYAALAGVLALGAVFLRRRLRK